MPRQVKATTVMPRALRARLPPMRPLRPTWWMPLLLAALAAGCMPVTERDGASAGSKVGRPVDAGAPVARSGPVASGSAGAVGGAGAGSAGAGVGAEAAPASVRRLRVDRARSLVTIQAYRGGALASAGHNHVIAVRDLEGEVMLAEPLAASRVSLRIPVALLTIDEPGLRERAGADFAAAVPDAARDGTRRNLLGEALLDAGRFPQIELESTVVTPAGDGLRLSVRARVRDHVASFELPVALERQGNGLVARGALELRQSALGLVPFSVMMGALQVQDTLRLQFEIVAAP